MYSVPFQLQYPGVQTLPGAGGGGTVSTTGAGGVRATENPSRADQLRGLAKSSADPQRAARIQ